MYLGIIPARGGSKGIPGKNYSSLGGIPLIQWTIDSSSKATGLDDIICTSDCQIIQDIAVMNKMKVSAKARLFIFRHIANNRNDKVCD